MTTTAETQDTITIRQIRCPHCSSPMVGARIFDPQDQDAFVGAVCRACDKAFRVNAAA